MKRFILLILLGIALFIYRQYRTEGSLNTIRFAEDKNSLQGFKIPPLLAKEKISGTFTARSAYLGGLLLRFENFQKISSDSVTFRLKEISSPSWYYQGSIKVDQFQPRELFPFGFPVITDSLGKKYYFEVESVGGKPGNAIAISPIYPVYMTLYQYPKKETLTSIFSTFNFVSTKLKSLLTNSVTRNLLLVSFSPLIVSLFIKRQFSTPLAVAVYLFLITQSGEVHITTIITVLLISILIFLEKPDHCPENFLPPILALFVALSQNYVSWLFIFLLIIMVKYMLSLLRRE